MDRISKRGIDDFSLIPANVADAVNYYQAKGHSARPLKNPWRPIRSNPHCETRKPSFRVSNGTCRVPARVPGMTGFKGTHFN